MPRRLRAALTVATLWAACWGLYGLLDGLYSWFRNTAPSRYPSTLLAWVSSSTLWLGLAGALCGFGFALVLSRAERDHTVGDLSLPRISLYGAAGAVAVLLVVRGVLNPITGYMPSITTLSLALLRIAVVGGISAAGSLAVARRAQLAPLSEVAELPAG